MRRSCNVMVRLTDFEHKKLLDAKPETEELATFARRVLLRAIEQPEMKGELKRLAAFVVAALSPDIDFREALTLYDDHAVLSKESGHDGH